MVQKCKICGKHKATRVTVDAHGQRCAHCGYCQRWQRASITAYLQVQHLFAQALRPPTGQVTVGERTEQVAPASVLIECDCPEHGGDCGTWLELTPDGFLILEDKDGMRVSLLLPDWLDDAIRRAVEAHAHPLTDRDASH